MGLIDRVVGFFVKDSAERRRFVNEFNLNAKFFFQSLSVDTLLVAKMSSGNSDHSYRQDAIIVSVDSCFVTHDSFSIVEKDVV